MTYSYQPLRTVRSVRDSLSGSNVNPGNHWVKLEVWGTRTTAYVGAHYERNVNFRGRALQWPPSAFQEVSST